MTTLHVILKFAVFGKILEEYHIIIYSGILKNVKKKYLSTNITFIWSDFVVLAHMVPESSFPWEFLSIDLWINFSFHQYIIRALFLYLAADTAFKFKIFDGWFIHRGCFISHSMNASFFRSVKTQFTIGKVYFFVSTEIIHQRPRIIIRSLPPKTKSKTVTTRWGEPVKAKQ